MSRDPRIVVAFNDFEGALDRVGQQLAGTSTMGVSVSDDRGQSWRRSRVAYPTGTDFLSGVGGNPSLASTGWMQPASAGGAAPAQSTLAYVAEAFYEESSDVGVTRGRRLVCSSSNDGGLTWTRPRPIPPMVSLNTIVTPSHPSVTIADLGAEQRPLLAFIGEFGTGEARVVLTEAPLSELVGDCRFRAPIDSLFEMDSVTARSLRRVKVASNRAVGPILAIEYKFIVPDASGFENDARCRVDLEQLVPVVESGRLFYGHRAITSVSAPCRRTVPNSPASLDLSHFDMAVDAQTDVTIRGVDTRAHANNVHLVLTHDPDETDGVDRSEVVYHHVRAAGTGSTQTHTTSAPEVLSDAATTDEIVFQPTVSAVALPFHSAGAPSDVFVSWYQVNANGQVRLLGRRRSAATGQWSPAQTLHSSTPDRTESLCSTTNPLRIIWSRYGSTVSLIDGWPARGALGDPSVRFDAFPLAVTLFTSSRASSCGERTDNSALFQELHAARWR